jgi:hypothetical protein
VLEKKNTRTTLTSRNCSALHVGGPSQLHCIEIQGLANFQNSAWHRRRHRLSLILLSQTSIAGTCCTALSPLVLFTHSAPHLWPGYVNSISRKIRPISCIISTFANYLSASTFDGHCPGSAQTILQLIQASCFDPKTGLPWTRRTVYVLF